jgi:hypothetical protein
MSNKIVVSFEVTNMLIMKETLKRLNHSFKEKRNSLEIYREYFPIKISQKEISMDSMNQKEVEIIKSEYQRDFQIYERTIRGETFEVTETKNEIVITVN